MTETPAFIPVRTPLELRALAEPAMRAFPSLAVGAPVTGRVHIDVPVRADGHRPTNVEILEPATEGPHPVLIYVHGGGWVCGDLPDFRQLAGRLAERGLLVINVRYGLAPEDPFPAGHDHVRTAIVWAQQHAADYGGDPGRIVIAGDSAGANIAAGICAGTDLTVRAAGLVYGVYDLATMPTTPGVHHEDFLRNLHLAYLGPDADLRLADPRVSPLHAAERMPPTLLLVGEEDPLVTESAAFAERLAAAGVPVTHQVLPGLPHGFLHQEATPGVLTAIDTLAAFLITHSYES